MRKKFISVLLCMAMLVTMTGCNINESGTKENETQSGDDKKNEAEVVLVYAEVNPLDTVVGKTGQKFKKTVEELSDGKIYIDIHADGELGSENDILDAMVEGGGDIDMTRISAYSLTSYGADKSILLSIPYTFVSRDHFWNFATSDLAQEFLIEPQEKGSGVRGLFYGEEGFRHFFTTKEITDMKGLQGMKLRVSNDPIMKAMVEDLGATPTIISFNELPDALKIGVVDGAEQPISNYLSNDFPKVANTLILDGHTLGAIEVIITDEAWNKLTKEQQDILIEAGRITSEYNRQISETVENEALDELKANGCNVVEVNDIAPWQEACQDIVDEYTKNNKDLYQQILDMQ